MFGGLKVNNSIDNLYKKSADESSPVELDNLILNQAKLSCETKNTKPKQRRWLYSLATAAVFVMGFSMIINLQNIDQEMQLAPQAIKLERQVEVEFISKDNIAIESQRKQRLKKQNPPEKLKLSSPKPVDSTELKEDARKSVQGLVKQEIDNLPMLESVSAPKTSATSHDNMTPQMDVKPLAKIINDEIASPNKGTINAMTIPLKEEEAIDVENSIEAEFSDRQINDNQEEDEELDKVVVTGSRIRSNYSKDKNKPKEIQELERLIRLKYFAKARRLLEILRIKYPNTDLSEYEKLIEAIN